MLRIAIDPGKTGGIAVLLGNRRKDTMTYEMPETPEGIFDLLAEHNDSSEIECIIEKVGYHVQGNNATHSVTFARHVGNLEMACVALELPVVWVLPKKWMESVEGYPEGLKRDPSHNDREHRNALNRHKTVRKNAIKKWVTGIYPHIKMQLWNADALGILEWRLRGGEV